MSPLRLPYNSRMNENLVRRRNRLNIIGAVILVVGLALSAWLMQSAGSGESDAVAYEVVEGKVIAVSPSDSKIYRADLERFGGKASILADEFNRWFASLWRGEKLALIIALLTIVASFTCFWKAQHGGEGKAESNDAA